MKGIEMPVSMIVIIIIAALVLGILVYFFMFQIGTSWTQATATEFFDQKCREYKSRNCVWSVTYDSDFPKFIDACRYLFGAQRESYSCLYSFCQYCKETQLSDIKCSGMCRICEGHDYASVKMKECCARFANECGAGCDVCTQITTT